MSTSSSFGDDGRFDELAEEFAERSRRGEKPTLQEYVDRLPELADQIRVMFPALVKGETCGAGPQPQAVPHLSLVGDYRVLREIGRGGMGVVYEAEQVSLGRHVALKVLREHVANDPKALERFRREAKAAARLHHTNIVPIIEVGRDSEIAFYVMQFIQGQGLDLVIEELKKLRDSAPAGKIAGHGPAGTGITATPEITTLPPKVASIGRQVCDPGQVAESLLRGRLATEAIEQPASEPDDSTGLVRTEWVDPDETAGLAPGDTGRDRPGPRARVVSSSAVLPGGTAVSAVESAGAQQLYFRSVAQIGYQAAQALSHAHARGIIHRDIKPSNLLLDTAGVVWITDFGLAKTEDDGLTATGDILGTLRYMAPERFRGEGDARVDIYALGLTLYELLALEPAFDASDRLQMIEQVKLKDPIRPRLHDRRIPRDLETIVLKAIEKNPQQRYPSADAMAEDLRRFLGDEPILARPLGPLERGVRWARRRPAVAVLAVALQLTLIGLLAQGEWSNWRIHDALEKEQAERKKAVVAREGAERARNEARTESYRALRSEARALKLSRTPGWRHDALRNFTRLSSLTSLESDLVNLRSEAVDCIGQLDVHQVWRAEGVNRIWSVDFSPDGHRFATADYDTGRLDLWDVGTGRLLRSVVDQAARRNLLYNSMLSPLPAVRFRPVGSGLAYATWSRRVEIFDPDERVAFAPLQGRQSPPRAIAFDRAGHRMAVSWGDGHVVVYSVFDGAPVRTIHIPLDRIKPLAGIKVHLPVALSPDGNQVAFAGADSTVQLCSSDGREEPVVLGHHREQVRSLAFDLDGKILASGSGDQSVKLWDVVHGLELMSLYAHTSRVNGVAFNPDGTLLASVGDDHTLRIWDPRSAQLLMTIRPEAGPIRSVGFSPDGVHLAAEATLYELTGVREHRRLVGHTYMVNDLSFDPRQNILSSVAADRNVVVWDLGSGRPLKRWEASPVQPISSVAYSASGDLLATGAGVFGTSTAPTQELDFSIKLWNPATGMLRRQLTGHTKGVSVVAFAPSGRWLASGGSDGTAILWNLETEKAIVRLKKNPRSYRSGFSPTTPGGSWAGAMGRSATTRPPWRRLIARSSSPAGFAPLRSRRGEIA